MLDPLLFIYSRKKNFGKKKQTKTKIVAVHAVSEINVLGF